MYQRAGIEVDGLRSRRENPTPRPSVNLGKVFTLKGHTRHWWRPACLGGACSAMPACRKRSSEGAASAPSSTSGIDEKAENALRSAARLGDVAGVRMAAIRANVNCKSAAAETALHVAAGEGHLSVVIELLRLGADTGAQTLSGATPLHMAVCEGHEAVVKQLLEAGASANACTTSHGTPLHLAAIQNHPGLAALLLKAGADGRCAPGGCSALRLARLYGHAEVGAVLTEWDERGESLSGDPAHRNGGESAACARLTRAAAPAADEVDCTLLERAIETAREEGVVHGVLELVEAKLAAAQLAQMEPPVCDQARLASVLASVLDAEDMLAARATQLDESAASLRATRDEIRSLEHHVGKRDGGSGRR